MNFKTYTLAEIGTITTGKTPPAKISDSFANTGIPFVTPKDMDGRRWIETTERYLTTRGFESVKKLIPANSIAVSCIGSDMGKAVLLKFDSVTNQQINSLTPDPLKFDYKYVYYVLSTQQQNFKMIAGGSATPIINKNDFSKYEIEIPKLSIQKKISSILDSFDSAIETNTKINQILEDIAQAIFKSWFIDFDPVKAKMKVLESGGSSEEAEIAAMCKISGKSEVELEEFKKNRPDEFAELAHTASLFPSEMEESELGEIPLGWTISNFHETCDFINGYAFKSKDMQNVKTPDTLTIFKMGGIKKGGGINLYALKNHINIKNYPNASKFIIKQGDVLMSMTDMKNNISLLGHTAIMPLSDKYLLNQRVGLIRSKDINIIDFPFIYLLTNNQFFLEKIRSQANSGVQVNLTSASITCTNFILPSKDVHLYFNKSVKCLFQKQFEINEQNHVLLKILNILLPKLLAGELILRN